MIGARFLLTIMAAVFIMAASSTPATAATHTGIVVETVTGGGYTYMNIDENGENFWIAGPSNSAPEGATVSFSEQVWMLNFESKALGRTFPKILFVAGVQTAPNAGAVSNTEAAPSKAAGGPEQVRAISDIMSNAEELEGKSVSVRGKVVKVSNNIMGRTWVHINDGSGEKLIFRSVNDTAEVGSTVTATGRVALDSDFGFGYFYPVIVEDATFAK